MKALVLLSGGLDSSVCLGLAVDKYGADEVLALSVFYGQKHDKELKASADIAAHYGVKNWTLARSLRTATAHFFRAHQKRFLMKIMQTSSKRRAALRLILMFRSGTDCSCHQQLQSL